MRGGASFAGKAFNVNGWPLNTLPLLGLLRMIERLEGEPLEVEFDDERLGDQRWYVSHTSRLSEATAGDKRGRRGRSCIAAPVLARADAGGAHAARARKMSQ
jgi:hypothetical protein